MAHPQSQSRARELWRSGKAKISKLWQRVISNETDKDETNPPWQYPSYNYPNYNVPTTYNIPSVSNVPVYRSNRVAPADTSTACPVNAMHLQPVEIPSHSDSGLSPVGTLPAQPANFIPKQRGDSIPANTKQLPDPEEARKALLTKFLQDVELSHLIKHFLKQKVGVEQIPFLTGQEFNALKVTYIGDRCRLRQKCLENLSSVDNSNNSSENNIGEVGFAENELNVGMGESAIPELGNRGNQLTTENNSEAEAIGTVNSGGHVDSHLSKAGTMDIKMEKDAKFEMGDKNNTVIAETTITAETIGKVGSTANNIGLESRDTTMTVNMAENAVFEAVNKNNRMESRMDIDASNIDNVAGTDHGHMHGLPGLAGNVHINMGAGTSLHGIDQQVPKIDTKVPEIIIMLTDYYESNKRRLQNERPKSRKLRSEFGQTMTGQLVKFYNQPPFTKYAAIRVKPKTRSELIRECDWNGLDEETLIAGFVQLIENTETCDFDIDSLHVEPTVPPRVHRFHQRGTLTQSNNKPGRQTNKPRSIKTKRTLMMEDIDIL